MKKKGFVLLGCICLVGIIALIVWLYPHGKEISKDFL